MSFVIHCTPTVGGGGEGLAEEATRISDSSSEDDSDRLAKKAGGSGEKKKNTVFNNNGWCSSRGYDMRDKPWCVCVLQDMWPVRAGRTHFVNGSTQFKVQSLKLHNESQKHKTCRDRCITRSSQPLPTSFNRIDESNRSAENVEMIIKFNTAYNITKEELPFTKKKKYGAT